MLLTVTTAVTTETTQASTDLLAALNAPATPSDPQPGGGICASRLMSSVCGARVLSSYRVGGGCVAAYGKQCLPPELAQCVASGAAGSYLLGEATAQQSQQGGANSVTEATDEAEDDDSPEPDLEPRTPSRPSKPKQV